MGPVQEIIRVPDVARLPLAPATLDGLSNLRGRVLPIISLRRMFGCGEQPHDDSTRALVINLGQPLGFVVDRVASVVSVEPSQIESADAIRSVVAGEYLTGVIKQTGADGKPEMLLTLDFEKLVDGQFAGVGAGRSGYEGNGGAGDTRMDEPADDARDSEELRLVSFAVAGQEYAIDIAAVQEIVQVPERITAVPNAPYHVLGLISLRDRLLPLVSLRSLFGLSDDGLSEQHRIVVVALPDGRQVGLVTDAVKEVMSVPLSQADPMPGILAADHSLDEFSRICRLDDGKRLVSIIATDRLLGLDALQAAADVGDTSAQGPDNKDAAMRDDNEDLSTDDDDIQAVIFRLGAEEFGVPIMSVQEIVRVPEVLTRVPKTPHFVEGVINLRGTVLPVIDQRKRLGLDAIERHEGQRIMVYLLGGLRTGFIVDSVAEVLRIPRAHITQAPALSAEQTRLIQQVAKLDGDKRLVMLIDPRHLLEGQEMAVMRQLGDGADTLAHAA
ncbi:chemotaxis protein CheW [Aquabacterium lacunae]|uniref:Chemotaxis protein CheW n=2 Tax=Aquabacterium lacunae TaxID=2528630 RepID=A0A4Q9GZC3_9BURK|nr:chemotaxis protein CheW [Aquabacterium lacunae]